MDRPTIPTISFTPDVCHTMQHWHIYRKWNERLFRELYKAYREGRATANPAEFWVKGELGFFDVSCRGVAHFLLAKSSSDTAPVFS